MPGFTAFTHAFPTGARAAFLAASGVAGMAFQAWMVGTTAWTSAWRAASTLTQSGSDCAAGMARSSRLMSGLTFAIVVRIGAWVSPAALSAPLPWSSARRSMTAVLVVTGLPVGDQLMPFQPIWFCGSVHSGP